MPVGATAIAGPPTAPGAAGGSGAPVLGTTEVCTLDWDGESDAEEGEQYGGGAKLVYPLSETTFRPVVAGTVLSGKGRRKVASQKVMEAMAHEDAPRTLRLFECDWEGCEYKAAEMGNLKVHKRTHNGIRPYACDYPGCDYRAAVACTLRAHKRRHSGERPFVCDEAGCTYRGTQIGALKAHKRTHTGERPFACDVTGCVYRAAQTSSLKAHKRAIHATNPTE
mmetsp:Transcript_26563/g.67297  ORF Transcript_26563/g.67297 Transcript_26563/m.67297 type:complete len:223 (-) Transcript_26563:432-1100(-)